MSIFSKIDKVIEKWKVLLLLFIGSVIYILVHGYRVSIGMGSKRYIYSIQSITIHLLMPAIVALICYFAFKRKVSFLKIFFLTTFIGTAIAYISILF